jgi:16S rRNA (guanine1516-N2)-methyltransferase
VIYSEDTARTSSAECLALKLQLPIVHHEDKSAFVLAFTTEQLELRIPLSKMKPIYVDFLSTETTQRLKKSQGKNELIARAVGIKGSFLPSIVDATAGLGGDAIVLAYLGCQVDMVERSPVIWALLNDGLERAIRKKPELVKKITLHLDEASHFLQNKKEPLEVVYLDPMFPERLKSALVKKEMRILKNIVGSDEDAAELFAIARQCASKRVVIKRPRHAPTLTSEKPGAVFKAKACRFDVYFTDKSQD